MSLLQATEPTRIDLHQTHATHGYEAGSLRNVSDLAKMIVAANGIQLSVL
jgi:hypothetical protein